MRISDWSSDVCSSDLDLFWYGVHGVEALFTVMGTGCKSVSRVHTEGTDIVTGVWEDGRIGTFRGTRTGKHGYGGTAYGEKGNMVLGPYNGYLPLLKEIVHFFKSEEHTFELNYLMRISYAVSCWKKKIYY